MAQTETDFRHRAQTIDGNRRAAGLGPRRSGIGFGSDFPAWRSAVARLSDSPADVFEGVLRALGTELKMTTKALRRAML